MRKNIVVGPDLTPRPEEMLRRLEQFDKQEAEIRSQLRRGVLTPREIQALIEHRNPFPTRILTVDYSVKPSLVNMKVKSHPSRTGVVMIDMAKVERVLVLNGERSITGHENRNRLQALEGKTQLDVRVLEELLKHPHLIPEACKNGFTYFWGTIFRGCGGDLSVAYLFLGRERWQWGYDLLNSRWNADRRAACLASEELLAA